MKFLEIEWLQKKPKDVKIPNNTVVNRLLNITYMIFSNRAVQSNRIESFNNQIKVVLPERGIHNEKHVMNRVGRFIQLNNGDHMVSSSEMTLPVSAKLGFSNFSEFIIHNIHQIV